MKNLIQVSLFALAAISLNSCASISNTADDDVYVVKSALIPVDESLNDETSYSAYKYKKDRNNNNVQYRNGMSNNNSFSPFIGGGYYGFNTGMYGMYNPYMYDPYLYRSFGYSYSYSPYGYYSPYSYYNSYNSGLMYMPGYGWTYMGGMYGNPYYGNPYYGYHNGYYGGGYGGYYGGGYYGNNGWGNNGWGNNGWSNNNNWNNPSQAANHYSGARGTTSGSGTLTRRDTPGTLKMGTNPNAGTSGRATSQMASSPVSKEPITTTTTSGRSAAVVSSRTPVTIGGDNSSNGNNGAIRTGSTGRGGAEISQPVSGRINQTNVGTGTISRGERTIISNPNAASGSGRTNNSTLSPAGSSENTGRSPGNLSSPSRNSGSGTTTAPARSSGSREISAPQRSSGSREISVPQRSSAPSTISPSRGSSGGGGGNTGGGGSAPRSSGGGSTGGGRR